MFQQQQQQQQQPPSSPRRNLSAIMPRTRTTTTTAVDQTTRNPQRFRTVEQLDHLTAERQESDDHHDKRVFRCLSNTTPEPTEPMPGSSITCALSPDAARAECSSLKRMFAPPLPDVRDHPSQHRLQQPQRLSIFYGCRLDRSTTTQLPLRRSGKSRAAREPLPEDQHQQQQQPLEATATPAKKGVSFQHSVKVVCIPSHKDYAKDLKRAVWGSLKDIKINAVRNTAEYIHDRCNWRKATEENEMYRDERSGAFIHPVHVQRYYNAWKKAKRKQQEKKEAEAASDENGSAKQPADEVDTVKHQEQQVHLSNSRKRVRCCSPSPIRRLQDVTNGGRNSIGSSNGTGSYASPDRHQPKRQRTFSSPVPCRRPPASLFYQQQQQQDCNNSYGSYAYYKDQQEQQHQQQSMSYWQQYSVGPHSA